MLLEQNVSKRENTHVLADSVRSLSEKVMSSIIDSKAIMHVIN